MNLKVLNADISNGGWSKTLPKRIKVLSWGKNTTTDGDVYLTKETLKTFSDYQKKTGRDEDVALDFGHNTVPGSIEYVAGEPKQIAAYGDPELIEGDGLYLNDLEWTDSGKKNAKNYKDLSPAVKVDRNGVVIGLHSVALTEAGAVHGLKFYNAKYDNIMIKKLGSVQGGEKNVSSFPLGMDANEYNEDGANAGVKKIGDTYEVTHLGADDKWSDEEKDNHQDMVKDLEADDHKSEYGDVNYADKENHKYPIDNEEHIRAAWSYINMPKNAEKYESDKLSAIKSHIKSAAEKQGIEIKDKNVDEQTKTMSANNPSFPDAYKAQTEHNNSMNDTIIKKMAAEVGMESETDAEKVLFAFLAKYEGLKSEIKGQVTNKANTEDGGLKQFSAKFEALENEIKMLKNQKIEEVNKHTEFERQTLISQASREGKIIPLSANEIKTVDVAILRSIVSNQPKNVVPLTSKLRVLSVDNSKKPSRDTSVSAFEAMIAKA